MQVDTDHRNAESFQYLTLIQLKSTLCLSPCPGFTAGLKSNSLVEEESTQCSQRQHPSITLFCSLNENDMLLNHFSTMNLMMFSRQHNAS